MTQDDSQPVSVWIEALKGGDQRAVQKLWGKYHNQLMAFARRKLGSVPTRSFDEEDIVVSAFHSFCAGACENGFQKLDNRRDLWALLATIIARRVLMMKRYMTRECRGGGGVSGESAFVVPGSSDVDRRRGIENVADNLPTPDFAAQVSEELENLLRKLADPTLRLIAVAKMEGWSNVEIAERLGLTDRTVRRKLKIIAMKWENKV